MVYTQNLAGGYKIIFGTDFEYSEGDLSEVQNNPAPFPGVFIPGVHFDYEVNTTVIAPYVHSEWQVLENIRLTAELHYEHTRYDYINKTGSRTLTRSRRYLRPDNDVDTFSNLSPKIGLVQQLTEDKATFINYAHGNRAPQTADLYRAQITPTKTGATADSETIDSVELGIRKVGQ